MNLNLSYNWLKDYIKLNISAADFAKEFSLKSMTVDRVDDLMPKFKDIITAKIVEIKAHPNADKLKLAIVDTGRGQQTVVCGAPNIEVGQIVALASEGSQVIDSHNGSEVILKKAVIRGVESNGMICSEKELGIGESHKGIMVLSDKVGVGIDLEKVISFDDSIFDIEVTTNRPDAMSVVGLAQEAAAVFNKKLLFKVPKPTLVKDFEKPLSVTIKDPKLCPRYQAVVMTDFEVGPSPAWLQQRLMSAGLKPINNLVDITNYIAFEYGQPMHVFDYDKLQGNKIIVRKAKAGEKIKALGDNEYELSSNNLVIADAKNPIAVAGVMGGMDSASYEDTKTLVFEAANFDPVSIRRTSRGLNLFSDSASRFEKGLHPEGTQMALLRAMELAQAIAGARAISPIIDQRVEKFTPNKIKFELSEVKRHLGINLSYKEVKKILESLGFKVSGNKKMTVTVPWWRTHDVTITNDLIEEIARMYGYHNFDSVLPDGDLPVQDNDLILSWEAKTKDYLVGMGLTEVYNYSFISEESLTKVGLSTKKTVKINNPLNEEMVYMRTTLVPQILQNIRDNFNNYPDQKIFELSNTYHLTDEKDLPEETPRLIGGFIAKSQNPFLLAKGAVELLLKKMGIVNLNLTVPDFHNLMWAKNSSLDIKIGDQYIGQIAIVAQDILDRFGIEVPVAVFDIDFTLLVEHATGSMVYTQIPDFPSVERDVSIVVSEDLLWRDIQHLVIDSNDLIVGVEYLSTYSDNKVIGEGKKALSFRIIFRSVERTLKSSEVDEIMKEIENKIKQKFDAVIR